MKFRAILLIIGGLAGLCVLALLALGLSNSIQGKRELAAIKDEIKSQGGKLHADELGLTPGGRIGSDFKTFCEKVKSLSELKRSIEREWGLLQHPQVDIGLFVPIHSASPTEFKLKEGASWEDVQKAYDPLRQQWDELVEFAGTHDIAYVPDYLSGAHVKFEHLSPTLDCAKFGRVLTQLEVQRHDLDRACTYMQEARSIHEKLNASAHGTLIQGLVQITVDAIWMQDARMILCHDAVEQGHIQHIGSIFQGRNYFMLLEKAFEGERLLFGNWIWEYLRNEGSYNALMFIGGMYQPNPVENFLSTILTVGIYRPFLIDSDEAYYLKNVWATENYARSAVSNAQSYQDYLRFARDTEDFLANASWLERIQKIFSATGLPALEGATKKFIWSESAIRQLRMAVALERYHLEHGRYPDDLNGLDGVSAQDRIDPVNHEPMLYSRDEERGYVLYSRGENGVDDGGAIVPSRKDGSGYRDDTAPDWVWPRPTRSD